MIQVEAYKCYNRIYDYGNIIEVVRNDVYPKTTITYTAH